jgi:hypothetical protein
MGCLPQLWVITHKIPGLQVTVNKNVATQAWAIMTIMAKN